MAFECGMIVEMDVTDVAYGGRGVGRVEGMAVFVAGALASERVRVQLTAVRPRYAEAALREVMTPSAQRIDAICPLTGQCPGCTYQHLDYAGETQLKSAQLAALLQRIGGLGSVQILPPIASPLALGYRNKIVLHRGVDVPLGYYSGDNRTLLDVARCPLATDAINEDLAAVRADAPFIATLNPGQSVTFRWTETDGPMHWVDSEAGPGRLTEHTPAGNLQVPKRGFFQVNPSAAARLTDQVMQRVRRAAPEFLIDLFCGTGVFAVASAKVGVPHVLGIERNPGAVRAAKENAIRLGIEAVFVAGNAEILFAQAMNNVVAARTLVIVDPPREGLAPALVTALCIAAPAHLLYISCAPDTLARDLKRLAGENWQVVHTQVINMFPRTAHFETLTLLTAPPGKGA